MKALLGVVAGLLLAGVISTEGALRRRARRAPTADRTRCACSRSAAAPCRESARRRHPAPSATPRSTTADAREEASSVDAVSPRATPAGPRQGPRDRAAMEGPSHRPPVRMPPSKKQGRRAKRAATRGTCTTNADCASGNVCAFPQAAGCAATGACFPGVAAVCNVIEPACACDGTDIILGCNGLPGGHAAKPFAHTGACGD